MGLALVVLSAACSSGSSPESAERPSAPASSAAPATSAAVSPAESSASSPVASTPASAGPAISFPPEIDGIQGEKYYAVFVAVKRTADDAALARVSSELEALGYQGGIGEIDCTPGAREQLQLKAQGDYFGYSLFFATKEQAQQFVDAYEGPVVGTAYITAFCLD